MNWLNKLMVGRYGSDQLSFFLLGVSLVVMFISNITRSIFFYFIALIVVAYSTFRMFSKNRTKRYDENRKFLFIWDPIGRRLRSFISTLKDSKTNSHFKCPSCGKKIRVPKGRGRICITCPACQQAFIKKT